MDVLLLAGYRSSETLGREKMSDGRILLDVQIENLRAIHLDPIVVLTGEHADETLRISRQLQHCELVFDANDKDATLFSNVRSGLKATPQACFVLPVEVPVPPEQYWKDLKAQLVHEGFMTRTHAFQLINEEGAPWHYGFPLLISAVGNKVIQDLKDPAGLTDARIRYHLSKATAPSDQLLAQNDPSL